ncbi:hypothetical protein FD733_04620 [Pantoea sp. Eser]|nr:hypothetical protein [Pantoea sp. Eser]
MPAPVPRATLIGLIAILLWSTTVGLLRSVSEASGATGGAALVYTTTALLLCLTRGLPKPGAMPAQMWQNLLRNPTAYSLAFIAAITWALYNNVTRRYARGTNGVTLFFILTAMALWLKYFLSAPAAPMTFSLVPLLQVLFIGASTAIAYSAWNHGIQHGNLTLLASLWLGLTPPLAFWQGVAMITLGSLICWLATRRL